MSRFSAFVFFNILAYFAYALIDRLFTLFNWYSSPRLGESISVVPTQGDIILIAINVLFSSLFAYIAMRWVKEQFSE